MHGCHVRALWPAGNGCLETGKPGIVTARGQLNVARGSVLHPTSDTQRRGTLTNEPPESNPLHSSNNPEVDERHVRMG